MTFLNKSGCLCSPYLFNVINLMAFVTVQHRSEQPEDSLGLHTAEVLVALFKVVEKSIFLHIAEEEPLDVLLGEEGLLVASQVILVKICDQL